MTVRQEVTLSDTGDQTGSPTIGDDAGMSTRAAALVEANERLVVGMMLAQAEAEAVAQSLREATRLAELDPLTGLPNRVLLFDRIAQALVAADRHHGKTALLFIDLDQFKALNDTLGHAAGDETLRRVAACLLSAVRKADTVCRFGGDEFVVLLTEVSATPGAGLIAAKIIAAIGEAGPSRREGPSISASIGISVYPDDGEDVQTLIDLADAAMYRAKAFGGGYFLFHSAAAALETSGRLRQLASTDRRAATRRAEPAAIDPLDAHLREANEALLLAALRVRDEQQRAEESLQLAMEAAGMASWELDLSSDRVTRSVGSEGIFGDPPVAPEPLADFLGRFVREDREAVARALDAARASRRLEFERRLRRTSDGSLRWLRFKGRTIFERGRARRIVGIVGDESERRSVEAQLRQAQKMDAVGQFTGGIAHDFNNLLLVIGGNLELLERRMPTDERTTRLLASARRAVANGGKLNEQLLAFARRQDLQLDVIAVAELLPTFEDLLRSAVSGAVVVEVVAKADAWHCHGDSHQLEVAILNVAINARDAMPGGGTLTLEVDNQVVPSAFASEWGGTGGQYVAIRVSDTGCGMPADVKARAFEPFFTTKETGKGTGLGLSQVYGFARQCGGFASIADGPGGGTVVTIHLPRSTLDRSRGQVPEPPDPEPKGNGLAVLVVEDDEEVRAVTHAMLDELEYLIIEAESADAALAILSGDTVVDVVLSDVVMPGTNGFDLARAIRLTHPHLPVLLMSGYTAQQTVREEVGGSWPVLRKPFTRAALSTAMQTLLKSGPAR